MMNQPHVRLKFDQHGLGDCVHAALALQMYRSRGYRVTVQTEANKEWLWAVVGIEQVKDAGLPNHPYHYLPSLDAFFDLNLPDHLTNKVAGFFEHTALPRLGDKQAVWDELCQQRLDFASHIPAAAHQEAAAFLQGLPQPIFVLHSQGTNWSREKSLPTEVAFQLILELLDNTSGSVVVLDYDRRAPLVSDRRCRGIKPGWGHIGIDRLCALLLQTDLLIGVDSGPFHVASALGVKSLGVFRKIPSVRCCLPHPNTTYLVSATQHEHWLQRAAVWSFTEYAEEEPTAWEIATVAARLAAGADAGSTVIMHDPALAGRYVYRRVEHDERSIELKPDGSIGEGAGRCERYWRSFVRDQQPVIQICGEHGTICECERQADGVFHGRWSKFEQMEIELVSERRMGIPARPELQVDSNLGDDFHESTDLPAIDLPRLEVPSLATETGRNAHPTDVVINGGQIHCWSVSDATALFPSYHPTWNLPVGTRGNGMLWLLDPHIERSDLDACGVDHEDWMFPYLRIAEGAVCLDLASFVGTHAVWWAKQGARVIAVEPVPHIRDTLYRNLILNQVTDSVTVIPKAFGNRVDRVAMQVNSYNSMIAEVGDCQVDLTTIDVELLPTLSRLDVIKLDVEGAECDVIAGATETIKRFRPRLIIEVHSHLPGREANGGILTQQFVEMGYRSHRIWQNTDAYYYVEALPN